MIDLCDKHQYPLHDDCMHCGAPVCCLHCCREAKMEAEIAQLKVTRAAALSREKEANRDWSTVARGWTKERAEFKAEITRLQAIIDRAPHDSSCWKGMSRGKHGARQWECNCWKAGTKKASEDA